MRIEATIANYANWVQFAQKVTLKIDRWNLFGAFQNLCVPIKSSQRTNNNCSIEIESREKLGLDTDQNHHSRLVISRELGHKREQITAVYLGR